MILCARTRARDAPVFIPGPDDRLTRCNAEGTSRAGPFDGKPASLGRLIGSRSVHDSDLCNAGQSFVGLSIPVGTNLRLEAILSGPDGSWRLVTWFFGPPTEPAAAGVRRAEKDRLDKKFHARTIEDFILKGESVRALFLLRRLGAWRSLLARRGVGFGSAIVAVIDIDRAARKRKRKHYQ
jgi:hypothetical protein